MIIDSRKGEFYTVRFENSKGGIRLKEHKIFPSQNAAEENVTQREKKRSYQIPYGYVSEEVVNQV